MAIKDDNRVIRSEKKDAIEELLLHALNDENSIEATFKCKNCENNFKLEVNSKFEASLHKTH